MSARSVAVGSLLLTLAAPVAADEPKLAPKIATPVQPNTVAVQVTKITVNNKTGVPGEQAIFTVKLTKADGSGLGNKKVTLLLKGANGEKDIDYGEQSTGPDGTTNYWFKIPRYAQGAYEIQVKFAGEAGLAASSYKGNLSIFKVMVKIEPKLDAVGNSPDYRWWTPRVTQITNGESINTYVMVTIDNQEPRKVLTGQALGWGKKTEPVKQQKVTVHFEGNDFAIAKKVSFTVP